MASTPPAEECRRFDAATYEELEEVPERHLAYLDAQFARHGVPLGFVFVRHVLVAGSIDLSDIELIPVGDQPRPAPHRPAPHRPAPPEKRHQAFSRAPWRI